MNLALKQHSPNKEHGKIIVKNLRNLEMIGISAG